MPLAPKHTIASGRPFFANVGEVVDRLDQHTLASPLEQYYWLTGAKDGWGFRVTTPPGAYYLGIYVYDSTEGAIGFVATAERAGLNATYVYGNALMVILGNEDDPEWSRKVGGYIDALRIDVNDGVDG